MARERKPMIKIQCPCCHGKKHLVIMDENYGPGYEYAFMCSHCEGTGEIDAEVSDDQDGDASRSTRNHSLRGRMVY